MSQSIDLRVSILDSKAKVELKEIDGKIQQIQKRAEKGINLVSSVETRDAHGKLKSIVDTYKDAADKIEVYSQRINKAGNVSFSVSEKTGVNWAEKQAQAYGKAIIEQERLERSFSRITASASSFASLTDTAFAQYSKGVMSAAEATEQSARSAQYSSQTWQQYYNILNGVGQSCGITAKEVSVFGELSDEAFRKYSTGAMSAGAANKSLESSSSSVSKEQKIVARATEEAGKKAEKSGKSFTLLHTIFLRLAHRAISAVTRSFREAFEEMKKVDSELVVVRKVSDATAEQLSVLKDRAYEVGAAYGVAASDYLNAAAEMTRAGYREQAGDLAELATKLQLVGDVSQDVANQFLIATDKSYKMGGNFQKLSETIDKLNEIDNNFATSFEKVADGIGLLAPVAAQANVSFDEMAAAIGTVTAVTQRSGTESARALRSLFLNIIRDTDTEIEDGVTWTVEEINNVSDALKKYAPEVVKAAEATGELINPMEAVGALAKSYKEGLLTNQDLFEIVSGLGGKLRTSQLLALIQNWDMYNQMLEKTADAAGSADKEVSNALNSWEVKLKQLKNTFTQFVQSILDSEGIKGLIDAIRYLIESIDNPEATEKFQQAFENFVNSLVQKLPRIQEVINHIAVTVVETFISSLADNLPAILKSLSDGAKKATDHLRKELPQILGSLAKAIAEIIGSSIADSGLAIELAWSIVRGIIAAIPNILSGLWEGIKNVINRGSDERAAFEEAVKQQKKEEAAAKRKELIDAGKEATTEYNRLKALVVEYEELKKALDNGSASYTDVVEKQKELLDLLHERGVIITEVTGDYDRLTAAIERASEAELNRLKQTSLAGLIAQKDSLLETAKEYITNGTYKLGKDYIEYYTNESVGNIDDLTPDAILRIYDRLIAKQKLYSEKGLLDTEAAKDVAEMLSGLEPLVSEYRGELEALFSLYTTDELYEIAKAYPFLKDAIVSYMETTIKAAKTTEVLDEQQNETAESAKKLSDRISSATKALETYKKSLEGGEKGDTFKSYAEAYKSAMEMFEKGATGSNAFMSAVDLLIPPEVMKELHYDYEEAGKLLGSDFVKAMFSEGGDDYGANAANYIRDHLEMFNGVSVKDKGDGTFGLYITDMEAFAKSAGLTEDSLYALADALDIFDSQVAFTNEEIEALIEELSSVGDDGKRTININDLVDKLINEGKTARDIYQIVDAIQAFADADDSISINGVDGLDEAINQAEELNANSIDVEVITNADEAFAVIQKYIDELNGTEIRINVDVNTQISKAESDRREEMSKKAISDRVSSRVGGISKDTRRKQKYASGTKSALGGLALVNDGGGAEIISANGKAWIAGGGEPTITNLPVGAQVFNAKQTREILTRSGINAFPDSVGNLGGIPTNGGGKGGKSKTKSLDKLLEEIGEYIEDILEKAREALQEQLDAIDEQIEKLKREHDAEEDANKLEELRLKILEAEQRLAEAQNERTVRYYNKETGQWEWMADQKAVADAQKALQDARDAYDKEVAEQAYDAQIQALEDQKDALEDAYDELEEKWDDILSELESIVNGNTTTDIGKLLNQLLKTKGGSYASGIENLIADIGKYTESPISSLDTETTARILSMQGVGDSQNILSALLGNGVYDLNGNGTPTSGATTNIAGDTVYYINGVKIGSDMMDKPLSQILSVLPIYAS